MRKSEKHNGAAMRIAKRYNRNNEPVSVITMMEVNHTPSSSFNLFSVSHCLRKGWKVHGDFTGFTLTRGEFKIVFDIRIKSGIGYLWTAKIVPCVDPEGFMEMANITSEQNNESGGSSPVGDWRK